MDQTFELSPDIENVFIEPNLSRENMDYDYKTSSSFHTENTIFSFFSLSYLSLSLSLLLFLSSLLFFISSIENYKQALTMFTAIAVPFGHPPSPIKVSLCTLSGQIRQFSKFDSMFREYSSEAISILQQGHKVARRPELEASQVAGFHSLSNAPAIFTESNKNLTKIVQRVTKIKDGSKPTYDFLLERVLSRAQFYRDLSGAIYAREKEKGNSLRWDTSFRINGEESERERKTNILIAGTIAEIVKEIKEGTTPSLRQGFLSDAPSGSVSARVVLSEYYHRRFFNVDYSSRDFPGTFTGLGEKINILSSLKSRGQGPHGTTIPLENQCPANCVLLLETLLSVEKSVFELFLTYGNKYSLKQHGKELAECGELFGYLKEAMKKTVNYITKKRIIGVGNDKKSDENRITTLFSKIQREKKYLKRKLWELTLEEIGGKNSRRYDNTKKVSLSRSRVEELELKLLVLKRITNIYQMSAQKKRIIRIFREIMNLDLGVAEWMLRKT